MTILHNKGECHIFELHYMNKAGMNREKAAILAAEDRNRMKEIIDITPEEIKDLYKRMASPGSPNISGMPSGGGGSPCDSLVIGIDRAERLRKRYAEAVEFMKWFEPAFTALPEEERLMIREFYMGTSRRSGATYRIMWQIHQSERTVQRKRRDAITHLARLLFP